MRIAPAALAKQPPFTLQPSPELRVGQRGQQPDHSQRDRTILNEVGHAIEDVVGIVIEPYDEAGHHLYAVALNLLDRFEQIVTQVLAFLCFSQALFDWSLYTQERTVEPGSSHPIEQLIVFREVDTGLGDEGERTAMTLLPRGKVRQQLLDVLFVADEVVVDDEDRPAPSGVAQRVQL